jgi:hypothetical protein
MASLEGTMENGFENEKFWQNHWEGGDDHSDYDCGCEGTCWECEEEVGED